MTNATAIDTNNATIITTAVEEIMTASIKPATMKKAKAAPKKSKPEAPFAAHLADLAGKEDPRMALIEAVEKGGSLPTPSGFTNAPKKAPKAKVEEPAVVIEPTTFAGFEVKCTAAEAEALTQTAEAAKAAVEAISRKDQDLLTSYMLFGHFQSEVSKMFVSTKVYGQYLAKEMPATKSLDAALRSNCKWLYEALNVLGHDASDLLVVLGVNQIADFKSGNPTVIKREYSAAKKKEAATEKAKESGIEVSEGEDVEKAVKAADKAAAEAAALAKTAAFKKALKAYVKAAGEKSDMETLLSDLIQVVESAAFDGIDDTTELLKQYTKAQKA
jgi:hypothetical protein